MEDPTCREVPAALSAFVDAFVDFSVSGLFLPRSHTADPPKDSSHPSLHPLKTRYPAPNRIVAIGDLHGDLHKSKHAFRLAGLIDDFDRWAGGITTVVQVGDVLDRGGEELKILYFLEKLKREASKAGGALITMNGNHEIMNVDGDFRYVTKSGLEDFNSWADWFRVGNSMKNLCYGLPKSRDPFEGIPHSFRNIKREYIPGIRARIAALRPDGPISKRFLSQNLTVLVVGDSVFVHGGLLLEHVMYGLERINEDVRRWICGENLGFISKFIRGRDAVVWLRKFSDENESNCDCSALEHVLATIPGVKRMIMGHTIQMKGINGVCANRAVRIDVGMSEGCVNGLPEVLEINKDSGMRILSSNPFFRSKIWFREKTDIDNGFSLLFPEHEQKPVEVKS